MPLQVEVANLLRSVYGLDVERVATINYQVIRPSVKAAAGLRVYAQDPRRPAAAGGAAPRHVCAAAGADAPRAAHFPPQGKKRRILDPKGRPKYMRETDWKKVGGAAAHRCHLLQPHTGPPPAPMSPC